MTPEESVAEFVAWMVSQLAVYHEAEITAQEKDPKRKRTRSPVEWLDMYFASRGLFNRIRLVDEEEERCQDCAHAAILKLVGKPVQNWCWLGNKLIDDRRDTKPSWCPGFMHKRIAVAESEAADVDNEPKERA